MKIISKRQAMHIYRQHPDAKLFAFCTGHYQWNGSVCHYYGREVPEIAGVLAVFVERRQDRSGPYASLRCVTLN
ncbi:TPA: DUF987 family protein [Citrobacter gillenii]